MLIDSMKSARVLNGKSVWMKTGYTLSYYPYRTGRIVFSQPAGWLPPAQELQVKDFVAVTTPPDWASSIPRGPKNAFVVFTEPGRTGEFAAPVASLDGANSNWACDDIFFYEDPKTSTTGRRCVAGSRAAHPEARHERVPDDDGSW